MPGIPFGKINHQHFSTTTSSTANETVPAKELIPSNFQTAYRNIIANLNGEGVYLEGADPERDGLNFPTAVTEITGTAPSSSKIVRLTDTLFVALHLTADDALGAYAITVSGTTPTVGTVAAVNAADTDSIDLCRVNDTTFACIYRDEGGDDYMCVRAGTVSGTTITMGTEKVLAEAAATEDEAGICYEPTSGCVVCAWADDADDLATIAVPLTGTTFGTVGTIVEFDASAPSDISVCPIQSGYFFVVYADGGDTNKVHARVASVSSAGAIGTPGTEKTVINAAGTFMIARKAEENAVVVAYLDANSDPAIVKCTTTGATGTTITAGTAVVMAAATGSDIGFDLIDNTQGVCVWCDDAHSNDVGYAIRFAVAAGSTTTITADAVVDKFVDTSAKGGTLPKMGCACSKGGKAVVIYNDADNDLGCLVGQYYEDRIIDIRSTAASAAATFDVIPVHNYHSTT